MLIGGVKEFYWNKGELEGTEARREGDDEDLSSVKGSNENKFQQSSSCGYQGISAGFKSHLQTKSSQI